MFAVKDESLEASEAARKHVAVWERSLGLRVHLQKSLDAANKLPLVTDAPAMAAAAVSDDSAALENIIVDIMELLDKQTSASANRGGDVGVETSKKLSKKRLREKLDTHRQNPNTAANTSSDLLWAEMTKTRNNLLPQWKQTADKWYARCHFGSEHKKSQMKTFNQTVWEGVNISLADERKSIEKARFPLRESPRIFKPPVADDANQFDEEVYDDRQFYSMLLKSFIASASSSSSATSGLRAEDLETLRRLKRSKHSGSGQPVDRKASKGRKIRYVAHPKLQNFMFPVPPPAPELDSNILFQSLFH